MNAALRSDCIVLALDFHLLEEAYHKVLEILIVVGYAIVKCAEITCLTLRYAV